jgi:hypothetical protein
MAPWKRPNGHPQNGCAQKAAIGSWPRVRLLKWLFLRWFWIRSNRSAQMGVPRGMSPRVQKPDALFSYPLLSVLRYDTVVRTRI